MGAILSVIYSADSGTPRTPSRSTVMMPLLVILFVVSYSILTMLVFEQGQTIESQRGLIREMLKDSTQLATLKNKLARDEDKRFDEKLSAQPEQKSGATAPAAGEKGPGKDSKKAGKSARSMKQVPGKPPADLEDVRRSTRVI